MNKKRMVSMIALLAVLSIGWWWRYRALNRYYDRFSSFSRAYYHIGEDVPFGEDYLNIGLAANGYAIRVDDFKIVDYSQYIQNEGIEGRMDKDVPTSEKLALVYITLSNIDSHDDGVMLTELKLHGIDQNISLDWQILDAVNPFLSGNLGIALPPGSQYQLVLPYNLHRKDFLSAWNHLEQYPVFLQITAFPVSKEIQVQ